MRSSYRWRFAVDYDMHQGLSARDLISNMMEGRVVSRAGRGASRVWEAKCPVRGMALALSPRPTTGVTMKMTLQLVEHIAAASPLRRCDGGADGETEGSAQPSIS